MANKYDVAVIGGGLSGVCAAIAAARQGCRVALIQDRSVLGGNSSSEVRVPIGGACDFNPWARETGILEEMHLEDRVQNPRRIWLGDATSVWDTVMYNAVRAEKGIDLYLETAAENVEMAAGKTRKIKELKCRQLGSETELTIEADMFVDASGDGVVAERAGAECRMGREGRGEFDESLAPEQPDDYTMGSSLLFHAEDAGQPVPFTPPEGTPEYRNEEDLLHRTHEDVRGGYWWIEVGNPPYNTIGENDAIRHELTKQLMAVWNHIKNYGDHGAENLSLDWIGSVPGKRESRRVMGDYILNERDVKNSVQFEDSVAYGGWFIDVHTMGGILAKDEPPEPTFDGNVEEIDNRQMYVYSIPFRSLYSKDVDNLFMAGRDVSATHVALGTVRLMATCAVMGEAVGTAVGLCKKHGMSPRELYGGRIKELQQQLLKQDCYIPHVVNEDGEDLARGAEVTVSSSAALRFEEGKIGMEYFSPRQAWLYLSELDTERAQMFPVSAERIERIDLLLESRCAQDVEAELTLYSADAIWDFQAGGSLKKMQAKVQANSLSWVRFDLDVKVDPKRLYWIGVKSEGGVYWRFTANPPTCTVSASRILKRFSFQKGAYTMRLSPDSRPYEAENILSGTTRPERWTNIWISDPGAGLPQSVELDFGREVSFDTVYLTFDTNLNKPHMKTPGLYKPPECVRDYVLYYDQNGSWKSVSVVEGNYQRRRIHRFDTVSSRKLRLEVRGTNGDPSARLYEIRVYKEG